MAVSVTANLTVISDVESITGWTDGGSFGSAGTSMLADTEIFWQNTQAASAKVSKNNTGWIQHIRTSQDMSATDTHLFWWLKTDIIANITAMTIRIGSSTTDWKEWTQDITSWGGEWRCFVQDLNATPSNSNGTINMSAVTITGVLYNTTSVNFRAIENCWVDVVRFGTGLTVTGTDFDISDITADDELVANKYGVMESKEGVNFCQGRLTVGSGATTTTFNSTDEVLIFKDAPVSTTLYEFNFVGSGNTSVIEGLICKSAGITDGSRYYLDASDTNADVTITGSTFIRGGLIDFSSTSDIQTTVFNNCFQITPSTGTFKFNSISNYVGAEGGALLWPTSDANIADLTFAICDEDVEYDATSDATTPTFFNIIHDDNASDFDVNNTSGGAITIALTGTSNGNSSTGSAVTFSAATTISLTNIISGSTLNIDAIFTTSVPAGTYNGTGDAVIQFTIAIPSSLPTSGDVRLWNGTYFDIYAYTGVSGQQLTGVTPTLTQDYNTIKSLLPIITPKVVTLDPEDNSAPINQAFEVLIAKSGGTPEYKPQLFEDNTSTGFSRRISQVSDE